MPGPGTYDSVYIKNINVRQSKKNGDLRGILK